jgi:hypothetical protein
VRATDKHVTEGEALEKRQLQLAARFLETNSSAFHRDRPQPRRGRFEVARESLRPRRFAVVSRPIRLSKGAAPIRRVLIFDDHPATIRLLDDVDPAEKRKDRLALVAFSALIVPLILAIFWLLF